MYVPFLLFVNAILLVVIFWEMSKINSRIKKMFIMSTPAPPAKDPPHRNGLA